MLFEQIQVSKDTGPASSRAARIYLFRGLYIVGLKFPQRFRVLAYLWSLFINASVTVYLPVGFLLSYIIQIRQFTPNEFLTSLQVAINCWGCSIKLIIMAFMYKRLEEAEVFMDKLDARAVHEEERDKIRKMTAFANRIVIIFAASYWSYSSSTFITSVLSGRPPYAVYNPSMNWRDGTREFFIQAVIEYLLMDFTCFQEVVVDSYPVIYINVIRTHLQLLAKRVQRVSANVDGLSSDERLEQLIQCVLDHKNIWNLFNTISPVISGTIFVQFLIMGLILGFTLINIVLFANISAMIASFFYIIAVVVETFPCCYYANCLIDDSDNLALAIFHSSWEEQDQRYKKAMSFFMQNTQRTLVLTAMKLFPITMGSNLNVAKFAFSVYTLMNQMDFGKNFRT